MNEVLLTLWFDSSPTRRRLGSALPCAPVATERPRTRPFRRAHRRRT
jgi:hypothetical protein